jgi:hypothetical protein
VLGWAEQNAALIAAWENGAKGGRPKKEPEENPAVTQGKPKPNPDETDKRGGEGNSSPSLRSGERATRLPKDWTIPADWAAWGSTERPDLDMLKTAQRFRDYWVAKPGKAGTKLDWEATWRNWVRDERKPFTPRQQSPPQSFARSDARDKAARVAAFTGNLVNDKSLSAEVIDVTPRTLDRSDLLEDDRDLRLGMASDVGRG